MKLIVLIFTVLILLFSGCSKEIRDTSTAGDEAVSGIKGKVQQDNKNYQEITIECENLGLGSKEEWEARGFMVEENIAKGYKGEFNITQQKVCKDADSVDRCKQKCSEINARLEGINVDYEITCNCLIH